MRLRLVGVIAVAIAAALSGPAAFAVQDCVGDADGNRNVTIAELVQAVRYALDGCPDPPSLCNGDADCNGTVTVAELITAVGNALSGCAAASDLVIDVDMLSITDPSVQVVDTRASYPIAHIPGALPLSPYTLAATVDGVDFQIADPETAEAALSAIGVRRDSTVVVYGEPPEFDPARVVWALRYLGHEDVRYLNGGWAAWQADFRPVETGTPAFTPSDYEIDKVRDEIRVTGDWVLEQLGDPPYDAPAIQVVDARAPGEFEAGRIPTAVHVQWTRNLEGGLLRPRADLTALYADLDLDPKRTTVVYCLAGWRASVDWLVLTWLGFEDVRVYDGSWLEWGNGSFPVEVDQ